MNSEPKIETRSEQPYAAVRLQVPIPFGQYLQPAWARVDKWLAGQGLKSGPSIIRYLTTDMSTKLDIEVGFFIDQYVPGSAEIVTGVLPAGPYATLIYTGPYEGDGVYKANVAIVEWAKANGIVWKLENKDGVEWWDARLEIYWSDPDIDKDPNQYRTELAFMVAEG